MTLVIITLDENEQGIVTELQRERFPETLKSIAEKIRKAQDGSMFEVYDPRSGYPVKPVEYSNELPS